MKTPGRAISIFYIPLLISSFQFLVSSCHNGNLKSNQQVLSKDSANIQAPDTIDTKINFYSAKLKANNRDADAWWNRGKLELKKNNFGAALTDLSNAVHLDSTKSDYYYSLADVEFITGHTHEARDAFETSIRLNPKNTDAILKLAELYLDVKKYPESEDLIETAIKVNPHIAKEYFMKGMIFIENNDTAKALSSYQTAVEQDPDYFDAYIQMGLILSNRGNPAALTYFSNASNIQPNNPEPYYDIAMFYQFQEGNFPRAIAVYRQLLEIDSTYKNAWYNLGVIYYVNAEHYDTALTCFNKAIAADSAWYLAYYSRGNCYEQLKEKDKALADFARAYRINQKFKDAMEAYNELRKKNLK